MKTITLPQIDAGATFDEILRGQVRQQSCGSFYSIEREVTELDAELADLQQRFESVLPFLAKQLRRDVSLHDLLFVDIETTGLSPSNPLFLIGTMSFENTPKLRLHLARQRGEERAVLEAYANLADTKVLLSFNGRHFDWPYIRDRGAHNEIRIAEPQAHFDLLPYARQHWKRSLPNCKLQTLETYYCGRQRYDDIPARFIPQTYRKFEARHGTSGRGGQDLLPIIYHNYWDVVTMAELLVVAETR